MDDTISRKAAIEALIAEANSEGAYGYLDAKSIKDCLTNLPSAEQERKMGKWIPHNEKCREYIGTVLVNVEYDYWLCDACGYMVEKGQPIYNFCPNCGSYNGGDVE